LQGQNKRLKKISTPRYASGSIFLAVLASAAATLHCCAPLRSVRCSQRAWWLVLFRTVAHSSFAATPASRNPNKEFATLINSQSFFCYDSVFVKQTADTIFFERYKYLYRDKIIRNSVFLSDTICVPYPVEVTKQVKAPLTGWQNFQIWCGRIALAILLIVGIYFVLKWKLKF
jgi:hypothetical protein